MDDYCNRMLSPGTDLDPPIFCDDYTVEGSDFCEDHLDEA